ncbi:MAG: hypothetical protein EBY17_27915 [Acidobacteriia bacterium]|nr:hypothetical protein [Terriglobia bacterium]
MLAMISLSLLHAAGDTGDRVRYKGGTVAGVVAGTAARIVLFHDDALQLDARGHSVRIPWKDITTVEYGMRVSRRYVEAVLISPVFLAAKRRTHYLTIGYVDAEGRQQAMVLEVGKASIRTLLVSLEAKSGKRIEYQDDDARKAGKG